VGRAPATQRAYRADWGSFETWCAEHTVSALPATSPAVARYLDDVGQRRSVATVRRRLAAVRAVHVDAGWVSPTEAADVRAAVARAEWHQRGRTMPTTPLAIDDLRRMSQVLPDTLTGRRDRALLLLGYGAGLRPGEIAALAAGAVRVVVAGLHVDVARGRVLVPFGSAPELCAVTAWTRWRAAAKLGDGPAFRAVDRHGHLGAGLGPKAVTRLVRRAAGGAGLDPARYRGLSLRRGMVAAATERGASDAGIMAHTGHRSRRLIRRYMHAGEVSSPADAR
jgi:site-specific recombinase XerD